MGWQLLGRKSYHRYFDVRTKLLSKSSLLCSKLSEVPKLKLYGLGKSGSSMQHTNLRKACRDSIWDVIIIKSQVNTKFKTDPVEVTEASRKPASPSTLTKYPICQNLFKFVEIARHFIQQKTTVRMRKPNTKITFEK